MGDLRIISATRGGQNEKNRPTKFGVKEARQK